VMISLSQALRALSAEGEVTDPVAWEDSGAAELTHWFEEIVAIARFDKRRRAVAAAGAIAERLQGAPLRAPQEIAVARLQTAWSHRARRMIGEAAEGGEINRASADQHVAALVSAARGFSAYSLEPWLEGRVKTAVQREILALLPLEPAPVKAVVAGLEPDRAHRQLLRVVDQIEAELREVLLAITPGKSDRPAELPDDVVQAARDLSAWTRTEQTS